MMALTGVRPSEALGLTWGGVDFADGTVTFVDTKNGTDHMLPMGEWLAARLKARRALSGGLLVFSERHRDRRCGTRRCARRSRR